MYQQLGILMELAELWDRYEIQAPQSGEISAYCLICLLIAPDCRFVPEPF